MLTWEEDVEAAALKKRGWSLSAIARHLGRDRKTIRAYLTGKRTPGQRKPAHLDPAAAFVPYLTARLQEDPHVWASALYDEVVALGFARSYPTFTRTLRGLRLRPHCDACTGVKGRPTIEITHPPGEELQWDWLELPAAPWGGDVHLLVGTLSHSGQCRAVFAEAEDQPHLIEALDAVLRRFGGSARRWRFDHMPGVVEVGSDRLLASFAAVAKYYGVTVDICAPRRANRKGAVEKSNDFLTGRWWRTMSATTMVEAQALLDRFLETVGDQRRRQQQTIGERAATETLLPLPATPYAATLTVGRVVSAACLVAFRGNQYAVLPGLEGATVQVRWRLGSTSIELVAASGTVLATPALAPAGAGRIVRSEEQRSALEAAIFAALTTARPCQRKLNRPPGPVAQAAAAALREAGSPDVTVDLERYAEFAAVRP
jgi:transposase